MSIYQGTVFSQVFTLTTKSNGLPIDISTWTFKAELRQQVTDTNPLLTVTVGTTGFSIVDGPNGRVQMQIQASDTLNLPLGNIVFDVLHLNASPGPVFLFSGKDKVKQPVTR